MTLDSALRRLILILGVGSLAVIGAVILTGERDSLQLAPTPAFAADAVECPRDCNHDDVAFPLAVTLASGETIDQLLEKLELGPTDRSQVVELLSEHLEIRRLRPGLEVTGYFDEVESADPRPHELQVVVRRKGQLTLRSSAELAEARWTSQWRPFVETVQTRQAVGVVEGSLVGALDRAGAPSDVAYRMADVLRWDVDFNRDLRTGDRFHVVYEDIYLDGVRDRTGEVVGIAFWNRGRRLEAYRHDEGYYDGEGRPLQKMFLRSPLPFTRVTSRFSHRRFHPVLKTYRPHYGVDYGAPTGTPVRATADGVVTFAAWGKGAGRMVKVRHPNDYLTAYLHLSKFGSGISPGRRVRQGDVIGYVGSSGLASGPHLDYRVQRHGKWIDPLSIKSVPADPISAEMMPSFLAARDSLREQLGGSDAFEEVGVVAGTDRLAAADGTPPELVDPSR